MAEYDKKMFKTMLIMYNEYKSWTSVFDFSVLFDDSPNGSTIVVSFLKTF